MAPVTPTFFETAEAFRAWLAAHGATERELEVGFRKVGSGAPSLTWPQAVDEALCFGWIDGVRHAVDASSYRIRFTPRRPGSVWSAVNLARVEALEALGRMTEAGREAWRARREDRCRVYSYDSPEAPALTEAEVDLLRARGGAWAYLEACPPGYRRMVIRWVTSVVRPDARQRRLERVAQACERGERLFR